jgi:hypothetical protein
LKNKPPKKVKKQRRMPHLDSLAKQQKRPTSPNVAIQKNQNLPTYTTYETPKLYLKNLILVPQIEPNPLKWLEETKAKWILFFADEPSAPLTWK